MGTGGWIVIAIIVIQAIAGGIAKITEARKAGGVKSLGDASQSKAKPESQMAKNARQTQGRPKGAPITLQQKLEAVKQRRAAALRTPTPVQAPAPPTVASPSVSTKKRRAPQRPSIAQPQEKKPPVECLISHSTAGAYAADQGSASASSRGINKAALADMLSSTQDFRSAVIFSELLAPPLALRPEREV
jgi:hypothetical protein